MSAAPVLVGHSVSDPQGNYPRRVMFEDGKAAWAEAYARDARDDLRPGFDACHDVCGVYQRADGELLFSFDPCGPDA